MGKVVLAVLAITLFFDGTINATEKPSKLSVIEAGFLPITDGDASPRKVGERVLINFIPVRPDAELGQIRVDLRHIKTFGYFELSASNVSHDRNGGFLVAIEIAPNMPKGSYDVVTAILYDSATRIVMLPRVTFHILEADQGLIRPLAISMQSSATGDQTVLNGFFPINYDFLATSVWLVTEHNKIASSYDRGDNLWPGNFINTGNAVLDWWLPISFKQMPTAATLVWRNKDVVYTSTTRVKFPERNILDINIQE